MHNERNYAEGPALIPLVSGDIEPVPAPGGGRVLIDKSTQPEFNDIGTTPYNPYVAPPVYGSPTYSTNDVNNPSYKPAVIGDTQSPTLQTRGVVPIANPTSPVEYLMHTAPVYQRGTVYTQQTPPTPPDQPGIVTQPLPADQMAYSQNPAMLLSKSGLPRQQAKEKNTLAASMPGTPDIKQVLIVTGILGALYLASTLIK